jgi:N-methylhydantoinase A
VTDADLLLGKIDPGNFAGGAIPLSLEPAQAAIAGHVGDRLGVDGLSAAFGIAEVVGEAMANAARVHAVENGRDIATHVMIAFGGAAPLHAARLCEKRGIDRCLVPPRAGVGSAIGFLRAPFGYEAPMSRVVRLQAFDAPAVHAMLADLTATAEGFVRAATQVPIRHERVAFMRHVGQGWEIPVPLPEGPFGANDAERLHEGFRAAYARFFGRASGISAAGRYRSLSCPGGIAYPGPRARRPRQAGPGRVVPDAWPSR